MNQRRAYTTAQKTEAIARVMAGESPAAVERDLELSRGIVQKWMDRDSEVVAIVAPAIPAADLEARLSVALDTMIVTLTRQAEHYGSQDFLRTQEPATVMAATRTVGNLFIRIMDRLRGHQTADERDND